MHKAHYVRATKLDRALYRSILSRANGLSNIIFYIRVSSDEQVEDGHSLELQETRIREYCERRFGAGCFNALIVADEGLSGGLDYSTDRAITRQHRPGLAFAMELVSSGQIDFFAIYKINRLARDTHIFLEFLDDLNHKNVRFISAVEDIDLGSPSGKMQAQLLAVLAESERGNIRQHVKDGVRDRMAKGYSQGYVSYGWEPGDRRLLARGERNGIQPIEKEAETIRRIYSWFCSGRSAVWIARELEKLQIPSPKGNRCWSDCTVRGILRNPIHCGYMWDRPRGEDGRTLIRGEHYPKRIIERSDYDAAQTRLGIATRAHATQRSQIHLLGTIAHCGICGRRMRPHKREPGKPRYVCYGGPHGREHRRFSVPVKFVDDRVVEEVKSLATSPDVLESAKEMLETRLYELEYELQKKDEELRAELARLERATVDLFHRHSRGDIDDEELRIIRDSLRRQRESRTSELASVGEHEKHRVSFEMRFEEGMHRLRSFGVWENLELHEKRIVLEQLVEDLTLYPQDRVVDVKLKLIVSEPVEFEAPVRGELGRHSTGLSSLSATELTTAYYLQLGYSEQEIAAKRGAMLDTIRAHRTRILGCTAADDLASALKALESVMESRKDELLLRDLEPPERERKLSKMELSILRHSAAGMCKREIAQKLTRSPYTVAKHMQRIYEKLRVHNRSQAIRRARALHLIEGPASVSDTPTRLQMDVLRELAAGHSQVEAARRLRISVAAVKERVKCMFKKFGVNRVSGLLRISKERGWLEG